MTTANSLCTVLACGLALITSTALADFAAPTAQQIVAQSKAVMKSAKTYQATLQMNTTGGPVSMNVSAQIKTTGTKMWAHVGMNMAGPQGQQNPMAAMLQNIQVVDDGKNTWTYMPAMKQYSKGPSGGAKQFNFSGQFLNKVETDATLKLLPNENVAGKSAYVVEATPKKAAQNEKLKLYFDQGTYHLVQMKMNQSRSANGQMPAQQQSMVMVVKDEKVNQPIPDSLFKFTPPPGAKQMQGGGMRMGMPGAGAPRR